MCVGVLPPCMSESNQCRKFTTAWAASMPDPIVADQVEDEEGIVSSDCLPDDRLEQFVEDDLLPMEFHPDPPQEDEPPEEQSTGTVQTEVSEA